MPTSSHALPSVRESFDFVEKTSSIPIIGQKVKAVIQDGSALLIRQCAGDIATEFSKKGAHGGDGLSRVGLGNGHAVCHGLHLRVVGIGVGWGMPPFRS